MENQTEERDPFQDVEGDDPFEQATTATVSESEEQPPDPQAPVPAPEGEPEQPAVPETPAEAPAEPQEAPQAPAEPQEAPQGTADGEADTGGEVSAPATPSPSSTTRFYKILYETAEGQWTEVKLDVDKAPDGVTIVMRAVEDGKPAEPWVEARNNEHALRIGYVLLDRPDSGARILPIPQGGWKAKLVRKAPPRPERDRLEIG